MCRERKNGFILALLFKPFLAYIDNRNVLGGVAKLIVNGNTEVLLSIIKDGNMLATIRVMLCFYRGPDSAKKIGKSGRRSVHGC